MSATSGGEAAALPGDTLDEMIRGYQVSAALYAASVLGVADALASGPCAVEDIAQGTGADVTSLYRLLRALASRGVFTELDGRVFALTDIGHMLRSDAPESRRALTIMWGHPTHWLPLGELVHSVRTGLPAFDKLYGKGIWAHFATHADDAAMFNVAMAAGRYHADVARAYDFTGVGVLADIGGGNGRLLSAILQACSWMRGILLDRAAVVTDAPAVLAAARVADRCDIVAGDFLTAVPSGADAYLLSNVLMDWDDASVEQIVATCRRAMPATGRLLLIERVIPADNARSLSQFTDLMALAVTGGRMRSGREFAALFAAAGLRLARTVQLPDGHSMVEARPA